MIPFSAEEKMEAEDFEDFVADVLEPLSTAFVLTLYLGGNPYLGNDDDDDEEAADTIFMDMLEQELVKRGVRSTDKDWDVSLIPKEKLEALEGYLVDLWPDVAEGMLKTIEERLKKKQVIVKLGPIDLDEVKKKFQKD